MTDRDRILGLLEEIHSLVEEKRECRRNTSFRCAEGNGCLGLCQNGDRKRWFRGKFPKQIDYFDGLCYTLHCKFQDFLREIRVIRVFKVSISTQCAGWHFLFLSVSTRDKRDEINIFVAGDPCRKEYPMLKVFCNPSRRIERI